MEAMTIFIGVCCILSIGLMCIGVYYQEKARDMRMQALREAREERHAR